MTGFNDYKYITVYAESTPNPSAMKFVTSCLLLKSNDSYEFSASSSTLKNSLFAKTLFQFPFVKGLFISTDFITITKSDTIDWGEIVNELREFIQNYLRGGNTVIDIETEKEIIQESLKTEISQSNRNETEINILNILDEYVRPAVEQDGGLISFHSFENGVVKLVLQGSCSGCPSSQMTLKSGIETLLKQMIPAVKAVEAVET
jgi:Fe-S cluster biogenesis protein NfuA